MRYISNRSLGKMGYALVRAALRRGADVTLVTGPTALEPPIGARVVAVTTAAEMREAVLREYPNCTAVIMAAAVADYRPVMAAEKKIKRSHGAVELRLEPNPDILKELGQSKDGKWLVGFAAETEDLTANAQKKLREKNLDMVVANNVAACGCNKSEAARRLGVDQEADSREAARRAPASAATPKKPRGLTMTEKQELATIVDRTGAIRSLPLMSKDDLADRVFDHYVALKSRR